MKVGRIILWRLVVAYLAAMATAQSLATSCRDEDGHRAFSFPSLTSPHAATIDSRYGWYPGGYDAMDGFRMGNYNLLVYASANIAPEFFCLGPRSWISCSHLNNVHEAPNSGSNL
jgi:hypothetical protein